MTAPVNGRSEHALLDILLTDPRTVDSVAAVLRPKDLQDAACRHTYSAILQAHREAPGAWDVPLVLGHLPADLADTPRDGWAAWLTRLVADEAHLDTRPEAAAAHVKRIADAAARRRIVRACEQTIADASDDVPTDMLEFGLRGVLDKDACPAESFERLDAADMVSRFRAGEYRIEWAVDHQIVQGQSLILGGEDKTLKTSLAAALMVSLTTRAPFLGRWHIPKQQRCAFFTGESGELTIAETISRICESQEVDLEPSWLTISTRLPNLMSDPGGLRAFLLDIGATFFAIDPAYMALGDVENEASMFSMGKPLAHLTELAHDIRATPAILHHFKRRTKGDYSPPDKRELSHAGFKEWTRQWMLLGRRSEYVEGTGHHDLWMRVGGSVGHSGLYAIDIDEGNRTAAEGREWAVSVDYAADAIEKHKTAREDAKDQAKELQAEADEAAAIKTLGQHPDGLTYTRLRDLSGIRGARLGPVFSRLLADATIKLISGTPSGRGKQAGVYALEDSHGTP